MQWFWVADRVFPNRDIVENVVRVDAWVRLRQEYCGALAFVRGQTPSPRMLQGVLEGVEVVSG